MQTNELDNILDQMKNSTVNNYVIAGLSSSLIGGEENGCVRLFEQERFQQDFICPHSHRFDFTCLVLEGSVTNRIWLSADEKTGDFFEEKRLTFTGQMGVHEESLEGRGFYSHTDDFYGKGDFYSMEYNEIHSIDFSKGAKVLFFEGKNKSDSSIVLNPVVDGKTIDLFRVDDWMFSKK